MIIEYDPQIEPEREDWITLDDSERIDIIVQYHKLHSIRLPNLNIHAAIHLIVENQVSLGDEIPVKRTVDRLVSEGLERHDAIHAVGQVLIEHMYAIVNDQAEANEVDLSQYNADLDELTAANCGLHDDDLDEYAGGAKSVDPRPDQHQRPTATIQRPAQSKAFQNVGRNDPCPCGSGKKFKKCCLN